MTTDSKPDDLQGLGHRAWATYVTFVVALLVLSRTCELFAVSLSGWGVISTDACRALFEKQPLLIAHVPIALLAGLVANTLGNWKIIIGSSVLAAFCWTAISASGHVLAAIFC